MSEKLVFWSAILLLVIVFANFVIILKYHNEEPIESAITGKVIFDVEINPDNTKYCCSYYVDGEERKCSVLERFDCSACNEYCLR